MSELRPILLVEDDVNDVDLTMRALAEHNLANPVVVLRDGAAAMEYLRGTGEYAVENARAPIVILLDLKMPKMNGLDVLKALKGDEALRIIPVVMLTSSREERDLVASYHLGVNAYVVKPVSFHEFVSSIKGLGVFWAIINEPPPAHVAAAA